MRDLIQPRKTATLLLTCPDRKGIVACISTFLFQYGANILSADQHQDAESGLLLMRVEWELQDFSLCSRTFKNAFDPIAQEFRMNWKLAFSEIQRKLAIFVSGFDHCLADLLYRNKIGELDCEISLIITNHTKNPTSTRDLAAFYRVPFHEIPTEGRKKEETEALQLTLLNQYSIDLVILARYMQIVSPHFVNSYQNRIINIHHSFLPAFLGAKPYHQAFARGVKLIGATSHYVTEKLDDGPIIHQDVIEISHRDQVADLIQKGRDLERVVLSRAVRSHLENRVIIYGNKTVVFD